MRLKFVSILSIFALFFCYSSASAQDSTTYSKRGFVTGFTAVAGQDLYGSLLGEAKYRPRYKFEITEQPLIGSIEILDNKTGEFVYHPAPASTPTIQVVNTFSYQVKKGRRILNFEVTIQTLNSNTKPRIGKPIEGELIPYRKPILIPGPRPIPGPDPIIWPGPPTH